MRATAFDLDVHIGAAFADGIAEVTKIELTVGAGVARHDQAATPAHQGR